MVRDREAGQRRFSAPAETPLLRGVFSFGGIGNRNDRTPHRHNRALRRIGGGGGARQYFLLDVRTNSCIWRCISSMRSRICRMMAMPEMLTPRSRASDRMNSSRCKSSLGVKPRVALGAAGLEQPLALVEAQRLRMDVVHLGHRRDHVRALRFALGGHRLSPASSSHRKRPKKKRRSKLRLYEIVIGLFPSALIRANPRKRSYAAISGFCSGAAHPPGLSARFR